MKWVLFLLVLVIPLLFFCSEEKVLTPAALPFSIEQINIPAVISTTSDKPVLLTARINHPEGSSGIDSVLITLTDSLGSASNTFQMWDDGENQGTGSGDVIAFDQVYTRKIIGSQLMLAEGRYRARIMAYDISGNFLESMDNSIELFPNQAPEILGYSFPDTIFSGMPPTDVLFTVNDNDGIDDVLRVIIEGFEPGISQPVFRDTVPNPGNNSPVFTATIDSGYAAGRIGLYELKCFAEDRVGDISVEVIINTFMENRAPMVFNEDVPDTLVLPSSGDLPVEITVEVKDQQSLVDIDSVYFNSYLPSGNPSSGNPFLMYDNGLPFNPSNPVAVGDKVADDGIYTLTIFLPFNANPGQYRFEFFARDRVGNPGIGPVATIVVQ
jgi:hypothetical protein